MASNFEVDIGNVIQISFECDRFALLVPPAEQPLYGDRPGKQANGKPGIFEEVGSKSQVYLQAGGANPMGLHDAGAVRTGDFHPAQRADPFAAVIAGEKKVPEPYEDSRSDDVDE